MFILFFLLTVPHPSQLYRHRSSLTKQQIVSKVEEQAEASLGEAMMYTLFEWAKENQESLMEDHQPVVTAVVSGLAGLCGLSPFEILLGY